MFTLTIETDNPAVLVAIAKAVKNTPPVGFDEGRPSKPPEVTIHTTEAKIEEAKEAVNLNDTATVKVEEPIVKDEPAPAPETSQQLRKLLLAVGNLPDKTVQDAKDIAVAAVGGGVVVDKEFPNHPRIGEALKALEAALV